jgi:glycosyltransferase involved in cell wall biosynthesis
MSDKLRIAYVDYVLEPDKPGKTGLSDIVWDMASVLVNQGHEAHIVGSYHTRDYPDKRVIVHNFPTPPIGYRNFLGHLWILKRAADVIRQEQFDIVHAPEYVSTAVLSKLGVSTSLVLTVPGNVFQRMQKGHGFEWWFIHVLKWAARVSVKNCARIIAISNEMRDWWITTGSLPENTPVIPLGINPGRFFHVPEARETLGIAPGQFVLLYAGRFSREKGVLDLLTAFKRVNRTDKQNNAVLYLLGKGPQRTEIVQFINSHQLDNHVKIVDWVDQNGMKIWYSAADYFIMPSWYEPAGRVVFEAMACRTAVISANTGAGMDHIQQGETGFTYQPQDINQLTETLDNVLNRHELSSSLGSDAEEYAIKYLTWQILMQRIVDEVYKPLIPVHDH